VLDSFIAVKTLANDDAIFHNNSTYERVRLYLTFSPGSECESEIQKIQIEISLVIYRHIIGHDFHPKMALPQKSEIIVGPGQYRER